MPDTKSGLTFLQRSGLIPTYLNPEPRIEPDSFLAHRIPLSPPLPLPMVSQHLDADESPPDRHETQPWPHPNND